MIRLYLNIYCDRCGLEDTNATWTAVNIHTMFSEGVFHVPDGWQYLDGELLCPNPKCQLAEIPQ